MRLGKGRLFHAHGEQLDVIEIEINEIDIAYENQRCLGTIDLCI